MGTPFATHNRSARNRPAKSPELTIRSRNDGGTVRGMLPAALEESASTARPLKARKQIGIGFLGCSWRREWRLAAAPAGRERARGQLPGPDHQRRLPEQAAARPEHEPDAGGRELRATRRSRTSRSRSSPPRTQNPSADRDHHHRDDRHRIDRRPRRNCPPFRAPSRSAPSSRDWRSPSARSGSSRPVTRSWRARPLRPAPRPRRPTPTHSGRSPRIRPSGSSGT